MSSVWTIRRSTGDAKLAGVCGGVARHWNVDPVLVRVGCVLLALSGGIGLVLYVAGWLLIPADGKEQPVIHDLLGDQAGKLSREVWIAIVVLACIVSVSALGRISPFGFGPALILALIWYFGYYRTKVRRAPTGPPQSAPPTSPPFTSNTGGDRPAMSAQPPQFYTYSGPPTAFTQAADVWRDRVEQVQRDSAAQRSAQGSANQGSSDLSGTTQPSTSPYVGRPATWAVAPAEDRSEPVGWAQPPAADDPQAFLAHPDPVGLYSPEPVKIAALARPGDRPSARRLRLLGLVALGLTLTGLAVVDAAGLTVPAVAYLAASLLVVGLILIAATWLGRARGILPVGILLAIVTVIATAVPLLPAPTEWHPERLSYSSVSEFPPGGNKFDVGAAEIDLSRLTMTDDATYAATVDLGGLTVIAPKDVNVVVDYTVDAGSVTVFGEKASGTELHAVLPVDPVDPDRPTLTLKLTADVGQIEVN